MISQNNSKTSLEEIHNIEQVRNQIADSVLISASLIGFISLVLTIINSLESGWKIETIGFSILVFIIAGLAIFRKHVPYHVKTLVIIIALYSAGLFNLIGWGLIGSSGIWFIVMILLSMIFYDTRSGLISYGLVVVTLAVVSIALSMNILSFDVDFNAYARSETAWLSYMVLIVLVSALTVASVGRVITVLQQQLAQFRQRSDELAQRTDEFTTEMKKREEAEASLAQVVEQLKELDNLKDNFIDSASHELRTPVANIQLYHQLIAMKPEKQAEYMAILKKETDRLSYIIEQMIHASSDHYDMALTTMVDIDLKHLVTQLFSEEKESLADNQINLTLPESVDEFIILAAPEHIYRALGNLVDNAVKYTPSDGSIVVDVYRDNHGEQEMVGVMIRNTGDCPSESERKTIFDRFVRGESSLKQGIPGAGLGLSIARQIVEKYNGRIEFSCDTIVESLTFTMWLPPVVPMAEILSDDNPLPVTSI